MSKVEIKNIKQRGNGAMGEVFIDGEEVNNIVGISFEAGVGTLPIITLKFMPDDLEFTECYMNVKKEVLK